MLKSRFPLWSATGLGGAFLRDILLGDTPAALSNDWYLPTAAVAALIGMRLAHTIARLNPLWVMLDAFTVGLYAAIGMTKALGVGLPLRPAMFVGVTAAVGGSALRDMLLGQPVAMLKVGTLYAVAATAGTVVLSISLLCGASATGAAIACAVVTTAIRIGSVRFGWALPEQRAWKTPSRNNIRARRQPAGLFSSGPPSTT